MEVGQKIKVPPPPGGTQLPVPVPHHVDFPVWGQRDLKVPPGQDKALAFAGARKRYAYRAIAGSNSATSSETLCFVTMLKPP